MENNLEQFERDFQEAAWLPWQTLFSRGLLLSSGLSGERHFRHGLLRGAETHGAKTHGAQISTWVEQLGSKSSSIHKQDTSWL